MSVGVPQWTVRVMSVVPSLKALKRQSDSLWKPHASEKKRVFHGRERIYTYRYWPPESIRNISSTVNLLLVSLVGLQRQAAETTQRMSSMFCCPLTRGFCFLCTQYGVHDPVVGEHELKCVCCGFNNTFLHLCDWRGTEITARVLFADVFGFMASWKCKSWKTETHMWCFYGIFSTHHTHVTNFPVTGCYVRGAIV